MATFSPPIRPSTISPEISPLRSSEFITPMRSPMKQMWFALPTITRTKLVGASIVQLTTDIQGCTKRHFPGCVNMGWKNCVLLPAIGRQNATYSSNFTQPGKSLLVQPCMTYFQVLLSQQVGAETRAKPKLGHMPKHEECHTTGDKYETTARNIPCQRKILCLIQLINLISRLMDSLTDC